MREVPVVKYNKEEANKYLTFEILESGTIYLNEYGGLTSYFTSAEEIYINTEENNNNYSGNDNSYLGHIE